MAGNWVDPLDYAATHQCGDQFALLYSSSESQGSGRYSFLATHPKRTITADHFAPFDAALTQSPDARWIGYLGYGLRHDLESLTTDTPSPICLPELWMFEPGHLVQWDRQEESMTADTLESSPITLPKEEPKVIELSSNMTKECYCQIVEKTLDQIRQGNFYQANITRKFFGKFEKPVQPFNIFRTLTLRSPSPFSAYLQQGDTAILSSSPEGFLSISPDGHILSRPIKGSAPRSTIETIDEQIRQALQHSPKDQAENLMIVDLVRNDLSRCARTGSVQVTSLFDIHSYATIHQMVSTVEAQRAENASNLDVVKACFPPGSMTGAPKIHAMNWCAQQETLARGVYSGAIGWISAAQGCDLSVVIRTIIIQGDRFEFQVGGGIVADSNPEAEWEETMIKATALAAALNIPMKQLRNL